MRGLAELPAEIILLIAESLDSQSSINALAQTNRGLYHLINPFLYQYHIRCHDVPIPGLKWAIEYGHVRTLQKMLEAGANPYRQPSWLQKRVQTSINSVKQAVRSGHVEIVEILLNDERCPQLPRADYLNLLRSATIGNYTHVIKRLLGKGDPWRDSTTSTDHPTITCAANHGYVEVVKLLLEDAKQRESLDPAILHYEINLALCSSVQSPDSEDMTKILLDAGADINFRSRDQSTPLVIASLFKLLSMSRLLLEAGADPNFLKSDSQGPLATAVECEYYGWAPTRNGRLYPRAEYKAGRLYPAMQYKRPGTRRDPRPPPKPSQESKDRMMAMVHLLFEYGVDPARSGGSLALRNALESENYEMARFLVQKGARLRVARFDATQQAAMDRALGDGDFATAIELIPDNPQ